MDLVDAKGQSPSHPVRVRARLRSKAQLTLPEEVRHALRVSEGDEVEFAVQQDGTITVRGYVSIPADQLWRYAARRDDGPGAGDAPSPSAGAAHDR